ncbi:hypothetical protein ME789_09140 [Lactobacillus delbrueckii]|nr:hypothetical protein ME789_09140 [Lactobacillus delbrueckii]
MTPNLTAFTGVDSQNLPDVMVSVQFILAIGEPIAILLMGTDTGALGRTYKGRTDSIMVAVLNPKTKKTTLVSFERDMQVNLPDYPEYSPSKLNAAYAYGNAKELAKVLKKYFNIPINAYVLINMGGLKTIINKVGGVDITPNLSFTYEGYTFTKGEKTHMDGEPTPECVTMTQKATMAGKSDKDKS